MPTCALCKNERELLDSHIVPKFVFRWMTATSGTKYLRKAVAPNVRIQDGPKLKLLCSECEGRFSLAERWFADHIFRPYIDGRRFTLPYDQRLYRFAVSLLWRILHQDLASGHWTVQPHSDSLREAESEWRTFLLGGATPVRYQRAHIFLTDIGTSTGVQPVVGFNRYLARDVDSTVAAGGGRCLVYAKFARFIFWGEVTALESNPGDGTLISPQNGVISVPQTLSNGHIGDFILSRARAAYEMAQNISEAQQRVIERSLRQNVERVRGSDLAAAMQADFSSVIKPVHGRVGRNDKCPCGSGLKYKRCHGA